MKIFLEKLLIQLLTFVNGFPTSRTNINELRSLITSLHPIKTTPKLIRLGPEGDGGYLIPNDIHDIKTLFSPGVSCESGFEKDCADLGLQVFMVDASVETPTIMHKSFVFKRKFIGSTSRDIHITLDDWVDTSIKSRDSELILQIDIEGAEYGAFLAASPFLMSRFRIIVVEFHQLDQLWNRPFFNLAKQAFEKILYTHSCVHIHPNNYSKVIKAAGLEIPEIMEFTFYRNDRCQQRDYQLSYPHKLDCDNTSKPPMTLPQCWYHKSET